MKTRKDEDGYNRMLAGKKALEARAKVFEQPPTSTSEHTPTMKKITRNEFQEKDKFGMPIRYVVDYYGNEAVTVYSVQFINGKPMRKTYFPEVA